MSANDGNSGGDLDPQMQAMLAAAEAALASLDADLETLIGENMAQAKQGLMAAQATPDAAEQYLQQIYAAFHDMKGVGGTFGYHLVTSVAANLCRYLKQKPGTSVTVLHQVERHIKAMERIQRENIAGDGGETGVELLAQLETAA